MDIQLSQHRLSNKLSFPQGLACQLCCKSKVPVRAGGILHSVLVRGSFGLFHGNTTLTPSLSFFSHSSWRAEQLLHLCFSTVYWLVWVICISISVLESAFQIPQTVRWDFDWIEPHPWVGQMSRGCGWRRPALAWAVFTFSQQSFLIFHVEIFTSPC